MKKVIGLIPLYDDEKESYWMLPGYMKVIEKCGALPIMLPLCNDKDELDDVYILCDGILFTGGHDVDPSMYGEKASDKCGIPNALRDTMEAYLLNKALSDDKPVFGICRGIQFFNAFLGGTLYQDLPSEHVSGIEHHMEEPYDRAAHKVNVCKGTMLSDIIGEGIHEVNSYHHQAIKDISDKVTVSAVSEDGLTEAIEVNGRRFAMAVQWHPEFSFENNAESLKLIKAFVDAC
ncbi:MAG: gamma-glutamyl-gamma-aminobutyrate hydrolase family protein [Lachnospiraceae bacterium]|nr:gamma-glutamyl-gamma-aminobutyrate hydrolase family protein [Lachnospiraceae bacterium]